jgi:ribose/xylose/arabinose/galactoside ABC-type transport system permease subunit
LALGPTIIALHRDRGTTDLVRQFLSGSLILKAGFTPFHLGRRTDVRSDRAVVLGASSLTGGVTSPLGTVLGVVGMMGVFGVVGVVGVCKAVEAQYRDWMD